MKNLSIEKLNQILPKRDEFRIKIEELLIESMESGEFRPTLHASIISFTVLVVVNWSYQWVDPDGQIRLESDRNIYEDDFTWNREKISYMKLVKKRGCLYA